MAIEKVSLTHEALMDWLILNPEKSMKECARAFGYSQSWLSSVVNSGCFQARLAEKRGEITAAVALSIPEKLSALASVAIENVARHIETNTDPEFNLKVADSALSKLGFGAKSGVVIQNTGPQQNVFLGTADDLAKARALITGGSPSALPAPAAPQLVEDIPVVSTAKG